MSTSHRRAVTDIRHPYYTSREPDWRKYRLTFYGGQDFIQEYLKRFSKRETQQDFCLRKAITYCPAHAKAAVIDVRNAIYQRLVDVVRDGGDKTYKEAIAGENGGVDLDGSTMGSYLGRTILPETLVMSRVGIFVDKDPMPEEANLFETTSQNIRPYLYHYQTEDILSWTKNRRNQLTAVLLRDFKEEVDPNTGLVAKESTSYRLLTKVPGGVSVKIIPANKNIAEAEETILNLKRIPFVIVDIGDSLLKDISDYQIALLNIASSDMNYVTKANFPIYIEQINPTSASYLAQTTNKSIADVSVGCETDCDIETENCPPQGKQISLGIQEGRGYPAGLDAPAFIHPSAEPIEASMKKQEQLKTEIRQLINIALTNIAPQRASADSKDRDERGLEAGLSYIGLCLEKAEREIAEIWQDYQGDSSDVVISYPDNYSLKSDEDRRTEADQLADLLPQVPSMTYQKAISKAIARTILGTKVSPLVMLRIQEEIDAAPFVHVDPEQIRKDIEAGMLCAETGSMARQYPAGEAEKCLEEKAKRAAMTLAAQTSPEAQRNVLGARGVPDLSSDPTQEAREEKQTSQNDPTDLDDSDRTRGEGR